jgi:hypothetical protein
MTREIQLRLTGFAVIAGREATWQPPSTAALVGDCFVAALLAMTMGCAMRHCAPVPWRPPLFDQPFARLPFFPDAAPAVTGSPPKNPLRAFAPIRM